MSDRCAFPACSLPPGNSFRTTCFGNIHFPHCFQLACSEFSTPTPQPMHTPFSSISSNVSDVYKRVLVRHVVASVFWRGVCVRSKLYLLFQTSVPIQKSVNVRPLSSTS